VGGHALGSLSPRAQAAFRRETVGFSLWQHSLLCLLTAAKSADLPLVARDTRLGVALRRASAVLKCVGVGQHADKQPRQHSGGQMRRVATARARVPQPVGCGAPCCGVQFALSL
jgi:predicted ABC-type transport system involved in lysophospholipase L1 biosynthesis ATPase subunit